MADLRPEARSPVTAADDVTTGEYPSLVVDLFAGPGGWSEGLRMLGLSSQEIGIEWGDAECRTRAAAGHRTIRADVATYPTAPFRGKTWGLIASPPCQDWSTAGPMRRREGSSGALVDVVPQWVDDLRPRWVACEQVEQVLPVWREHAHRYRQLGYSVWVGKVDAARFGVPQNRMRAVLLASLDIAAHPPAPTHSSDDTPGLFSAMRPAVTLADVLGLEPGWVYDSGQNSRGPGGTLVRYRRSCDRPSGTLTTKSTSQWVLRRGEERRKVSRDEAVLLQTFPQDYPFQGNVTDVDRQIGNAVPPLLAAHLVAAVTGANVPCEVAA